MARDFLDIALLSCDSSANAYQSDLLAALRTAGRARQVFALGTLAPDAEPGGQALWLRGAAQLNRRGEEAAWASLLPARIRVKGSFNLLRAAAGAGGIERPVIVLLASVLGAGLPAVVEAVATLRSRIACA